MCTGFHGAGFASETSTPAHCGPPHLSHCGELNESDHRDNRSGTRVQWSLAVVPEILVPLLLSNRNRIIAGVCGGIAEWLGWNPTWVRILYVLVSILSAAFPGALVYIVLWVVFPRSGA